MIKPILFNTEMVKAIMEDRKTVTRRIVSQSVWENFVCEGGKVVNYLGKQNILESPLHKAPYQPEDILYVRETWAFRRCIDCIHGGADEDECRIAKIPKLYEDKDSVSDGCYLYPTDYPCPEIVVWRPSIHMPKEAARIWLKVTDVRVERLHTMTLDDYLNEGVAVRPEAFNDPENAFLQAKGEFIAIWDGTIKQANRKIYGWDANPWTWVIAFERCDKPDGEKNA